MQCEVWEGFIFVNLDPDEHRRRLASTSASSGAGLEGYPFGEMTQVYKYRAEVGSNWKLFIDAFAEFYHAPVLHAKQAVSEESHKLAGLRLRGAGLRASTARTAWCRRGAACRRRRTSSMVKPIERVLRSGLFGPWDAPDIGIDELPPGAQPGPPPGVGHRLVRVLPQLHAAGVGAELVPHVPLLADVVQHATSSRARSTSSRRRTPRERLRQELAAVTFKEYALQDGNTLEATQSMHRVARGHGVPAERPGDPAAPPAQDGPRPRRRLPAAPAETPVRDLGGIVSEEHRCPPSPPSSPTSSRSPTGALETEAERYAKRLASTMDELQAFYDAAFPRLEAAMAYLDAASRSTRCPRTPRHLLWLCYSLVNVSFPVEVWRQPRVPDSGAASMDLVVEPAV